MKDVVLPHFYFFAPQVYFSEVLIAVTFRGHTDGHQSLARPLSLPRRVALDVLLPHCRPDHVSGSTTGTQFGLGCYPAAM